MVAAIELRAAAGSWGLSRAMVNVYWGGTAHDAKPWKADHFERLLATMVDHEGNGVDLDWSASDPDRPESYYWASLVGLSVHTNYLTPGLWQWMLIPGAGQFRDQRLDPAADIFLELLRLVGGWPESTWGAVFHDHWSTNESLPYEQYFGITRPLSDAATIARGYYWANLLTKAHLRTLGGTAAIATRCEHLGLAYEPIADRDAGVVRSTRPVSGFNTEQLHAMRDLLTPVLDRRPYRNFYRGPQLQVIKDPHTAFRYVPPEIRVPWFEDWPMPKVQAMRTLVPDDQSAPTSD